MKGVKSVKTMKTNPTGSDAGRALTWRPPPAGSPGQRMSNANDPGFLHVLQPFAPFMYQLSGSRVTSHPLTASSGERLVAKKVCST